MKAEDLAREANRSFAGGRVTLGEERSSVADRLLEAHEVAAMFAVPVSWVRAETRAGRMPVVELGRYRRYVEADVLAWLEEQKTGTPVWRRHKPKVMT